MYVRKIVYENAEKITWSVISTIDFLGKGKGNPVTDPGGAIE
jgi:hypothetical protein